MQLFVRFVVLIFVFASQYVNAALEFPFGNETYAQGGGGWSGNGGDTLSQDNTWFIGDKEIRYCIRVSDDFALDKARVETLVDKAIAEWQQFFANYSIGSFESLRFQGFTMEMSQKFKALSCEQGVDLEFLFGVSNPAIDMYQKIHAEDQLGLALRREYNYKNYWNPGYVWIADFSGEEDKVYHLLLHELGHVFGMKHNSVFVMSEHTSTFLEHRDFKKEYMGRIESPNWPYGLRQGRDYHFETSSMIKSKPRYKLNNCGIDQLSGRDIDHSFRVQWKLSPMDCYQLVLKNYGKEISKKVMSLELSTIMANFTSGLWVALKQLALIVSIQGQEFSGNGALRRRRVFGCICR